MTVFFDDKIECQLCHKKYPKLGLMSHIIRTHKKSYQEYKCKYILKKRPCGICGTLTFNTKFCSPKCTNTYRAHRVKNRFPEITHQNILNNIYNSIPEEIKRNIIVNYEIDHLPLYKLAEKYKLDKSIFIRIFKEYNIEIKKSFFYTPFSYKNKLKNLSESNIGKQIIQEYISYGGNLRGLAEKYNIQRNTLKKMLILCKIPIKNSKGAKKECADVRQKAGIRHYQYGKPTTGGRAHWFFYEGNKYQGSWEFKMGLWLKHKNIDFLCHKGVRRFKYDINGTEYTYCPDFYIPKEDCFIEVKGLFCDSAKQKMEIIKRTYPEVRLEIYDKKRLEQEEIFSIDKKIGINIEDYRYNLKENEVYIENLLKKVSQDELIKQNIINKKSVSFQAKEYNVPISVMSRAFYTSIPKKGTDEYYYFCFQRFFNSEQKEIASKAPTPYGAAMSISNGLNCQTIFKIIKRFRQGVFSQYETMKVGIA